MGRDGLGFRWTFRGRLNRAKFLGQVLSINACIAVVAFIVSFFVAASGEPREMAEGAGRLAGLMFTPVLAIPVVRRLHDLNRPGWHYWFLLMPIYNIALALVLLFQRGTKGTNRYGPDPRQHGDVPVTSAAKQMPSAVVLKREAGQSPVLDMWDCPQCGNRNRESACMKCGYVVVREGKTGTNG